MNRLLLTCVALFALVITSTAARAAVILHDDFESPASIGDNTFQQNVPPTGWSGSGGTLWGVQDPDNQTYTGTVGAGTIANMDGRQIVSMYADGFGNSTSGATTFSKTLANTLTLADFYTATISIGQRGPQNTANLSLGYFFELRAGASVIASVSSPTGAGLTNNAFTVFTISHTATGADPIGQQLSIRFGTTGANPPSPQQRATDFDNLTVTESVPEPTGALLIAASGCVALLRGQRRHA
jgi:hypothetical protein